MTDRGCEWCEKNYRHCTIDGKLHHPVGGYEAWHSPFHEPCTAPSPEAVIEELERDKSALELAYRLNTAPDEEERKLIAERDELRKALEEAKRDGERLKESMGRMALSLHMFGCWLNVKCAPFRGIKDTAEVISSFDRVRDHLTESDMKTIYETRIDAAMSASREKGEGNV